MDSVERFSELVREAENIVFFGGAGVSTESGVPDFRSVDGLYNQKFRFPPETMLSRSFFDRNPEEFYDFYRQKMLPLDVQPNSVHRALAELERQGKLRAVVTQNIDGLHQKAGSRNVYELHGSVLRNYCMKCHAFHSLEDIMDPAKCDEDGIPRCKKCGGIVKPDVVLYEEGLDEDCINGAVEAIAHADTLIIGGTSLVVYPAAGLIRYFRGKNLVLINKSVTPYDSHADLVINDAIGKVMDLDE